MKIMKQWLIPALLVVGLMFASSGQAATFLSNLSTTVDGGFGGNPDSADRFTTGSQTLTVSTISVRWDSGNGAANQVGIYTDNAGIPGTTRVGTFFTNPSPTAPGVMTYAGSAILAANTSYWMVVDITDGSRVAFTIDDAFVADPNTGGAVMVTGSAFGDNVAGTWASDPANLIYALGDNVGTAVPTLSGWSLLVLAGLIVIAAVLVQGRSQRAI